MRKTIYAALLALLGVSVQAGEATFDFSSDPTATLNIGGNNPMPWVESGGNPGGFLAITYPTGSQVTGMVFPDIDDGGIITAFKFEADLRVGNSTGDRAADGFSISIARESDPLFEDPGNQGLFAGGIMEGGSTTGIAISFDTWSGNSYSDGADIEGILVRVDDRTVLRHSVPTRHGACDDATSLQTGPRDQQFWDDGGDFLEPESWATLCWQPLIVELNESAQLTVNWKGATILDNFQTDFFPSAGRLVLAGRTGGANEHTHIDNIKLTTSAGGDDSTAPTNPGNVTAASVGARFATITWDAATDDSGRVGYEVEVDGGAPLLVNATEFLDAGLNPGAGYTYRVRAIDISGNASDWQSVSVTTGAEQEVVGFLLGEIYDDIPNVDVESLLFSDAYFDGTVSRGVYLNGLSFNVNPSGGYGDNYGIVIKGVLTAPETGQFDFFVRSDDASQFFLNESGAAAPDPVQDLWIAEETGCCNAFQEPGAMQTTAVPISLTAGREYGFTFVVKEGGGGDWGEIAMRKVGDPTPADQLSPIRGELLKGMGDPTGAELTITQQPESTTAVENSTATLSIAVDHTSPYGVAPFYQWYKDGNLIQGAISQALTFSPFSAADTGDYSVVIGTMGKIVTSDAATLSLASDTAAPTIVSAGAISGDNQVGVLFDELLDLASAETPGNYQVSGSSVTGAVLRGGSTVELNLAGSVSGGFSVTVSGVKDLADNAISSATVDGEVGEFTAADIGNPGVDPLLEGGAFALGGGGYYVAGGGHDIWDSADGFHFVYKEFTGAFDMQANVRSLSGTHQWAKAEVMARESLEAGSRHADATATRSDGNGNNTLTWQWRDATDAGSGSLPGGDRIDIRANAEFPNTWIRLTREDAASNEFKGYWSNDGENWTLLSAHTIPSDTEGLLPETLYVGMAVTSHDNSDSVPLAEAIFSDFSIVPFGSATGGTTPVASSSESLSVPTVVDFGDLSGSVSYEFVFNAVKGGASTAIAGDDAFAIKLDQWNEQGVIGTTEFGVADNLFTAVAGQSVASVFGSSVHVVVASDTDAGESRLYIDGVHSGTWAGNFVLAGEVKVMGARLTQDTDHMGDGSVMDYWATYQGALTDAAIADLAALWTVPSGLVAYWGFDGDLSDSVGSLDGTAQGSVGFDAGQAGFGQAISLDGTSFVEITDSSGLEFPGGSMSISGWFTVGAFDKNWQALISKGEGTNYRVARRSGEGSIAYAGGVGEGANDAPDVDDGNWHHFVAVSDATAAEFGTALYVDGVMYEVNATAPVLDSDTTNLYIGENPEALNRQWVGLIDDIGIWNRVLTAGEVSTLYAGGTGTALSTLVGGGGGSAISIARSAGGVTITFDGTLQSSDSVTGPYADVAGATSPAEIPISGSAQFFRSQQ